MNRRGFTLIEVAVVITLVAILATLVIPSVFAAKRSQDAQAVRQDVFGFFTAARVEAIGSGRIVVVRFDNSGSQLVAESFDPVTEQQVELNVYEVPDFVAAESFLLGDELVSSVEWEVRFYPDGSCDAAEFEMLDGSLVVLVTLDPATGRVTVGEELEEEEVDDSWPAGELEIRA
ncbi:MAG: type II secretion system protein [Armatimonadetes bacterium]|nr:type II secretion system protein [Armatimonadota bacterium]